MRRFPASRWVWVLPLFLIAAIRTTAVSTNNAWSVRGWQTDDGLPNNIVTGLAQTGDGYLWVANPTRLARFDGVQFEEFTSRDLLGPNVPANQRITTLTTSRDGALWAATDHGVVFRAKSGVIRAFTNNLPALFVESLAEDGEGVIWVKNRGGSGICQIKDGQVSQLPMPGSYRSVAPDAQGRIWYVMNGQVGLFRNGKFEPLMQLDVSGSARITGSRKDGVWVCLGAKLYQVEEGKPPRACGSFPAQTKSTDPLVMLEDHTGAVWIGTSDSGLFRYNGSNFENIPVTHQQILSLLEDGEGNIWAGTDGGGLDRIQPRAVSTEDMANGLPYESVASICQDRQGNIWAATENGLLARRTDGVWHAVSSDTNWPGDRVTCVAADETGGVWIGTHNRRIYCLRDGQYSVLQATDGVASRTTRTLLAGRNGDLWLTGTGPDSLQRLHDGQMDTINLPPNTSLVHALAETADGSVWLGTAHGLLLRIHDDVVTDETAPTTGAPLSIRCLYGTPDGCLWIGYAGGGLGRFMNGQFVKATTASGLFDEHISQIVADNAGWLWLGSDRGIFRVRQQQMKDLAAHRASRVDCVHYGPGEGLAGMQANFGATPGVLQDRDGRLWMPMRTALAIINPALLRGDTQPPQPRLKEVTVDDRVVARYGGVLPAGEVMDTANTAEALEFPPDHRHLEFAFTAPGFTSPENIRFQYQLKGFDNSWVDAGTERHASYSRLGAGAYRLLVRACGSEGSWSAPIAGCVFTVRPFIWQTWWFWLATLLGFAAAVAALVRFAMLRQLRLKVQALERQSALDRERTRIARDIHDDIGNLLTQVTLLSSLTLRDRAQPDKTGEHARQISATVEQVTHSLDEIVWAVNPRNDTLPQLIDYIGQFAMEFMQTAGIRCHLDLPDHPPHRNIPSDLRHNLFLVVKEALNNVARHSGASEVTLRIQVTDRVLEVVIHDNGRSFDPAHVNGAGNGLRNIRQRMDEIGGNFEIAGKPGAGTRITLTVTGFGHN